MKRITYICNICEVKEKNLDCKLLFLSWSNSDNLQFSPHTETKNSEIHLCENCLKDIEKLRNNTRNIGD